ncbi:MAG: (deoxy)nucleoside triphosphate pyrophosphohydrolase [Alphaproteobacteria bacterium]|nr:(deoxy)nucleoside triphosphate pyrophosphohydrolase [Alphaproteobacteria bacterium]
MMVSSSAPFVFVAAGVLIDEHNRVLLAQRPKGKPMAGLWEFPGGKVRPNERPEDALVRELAEELGLTVSPDRLTPLTFASHRYPDFHLFMPLFSCRSWKGEPTALENQTLAWADPTTWSRYAMAGADLSVLPLLARLIGEPCP